MEQEETNYLINLTDQLENGWEMIDDTNDNEIETKICRLCGKKSTNYMPIFGETTLVAEKISKCLPIVISPDDQLPSNICKRCFHYLNISYKLIVKCIMVDSLLREKLKKSKNQCTVSNENFTSLPTAKSNSSPENSRERSPEKNTPMICEMCNILFLDLKLFDKHIETHINRFTCDICDASFPESYDLDEHKLQQHNSKQTNSVITRKSNQGDAMASKPMETPESSTPKVISNTLLVSEKPKISSNKSIPNIIRSRTAAPCGQKPIQLIQSPLNIDGAMTSFITINQEQVAPSLNFTTIDSKPVTPAANFTAIQILPSEALKVFANPVTSLRVIPTTSALRIVPVNAKVAIPRITNSNRETKVKMRRVTRAKKVEPCNEDDHNYTNITTNNNNNAINNDQEQDSQNNKGKDQDGGCSQNDEQNGGNNKENDGNDSDDSCNLPLQDTPTVLPSTCAYDVQCDICGVGVDDDELLVAHKKIHLPRKMGCKECHQECDSLYDLYVHKRRRHNVYKRVALKFSCEQCGKFFTNSWQWENHEEHKCKKKFPMYPCKYCDAGFSTNHKLKRHLRKHKKEMLEDPEVEIYKCVACPKVFVDEEFYQKHRNVHDPECWDKYKCNVCNRSFRDNVRLREHQQSIHEGIKPHQCDICGRTFHRRSNMKVHREKHFARKCDHCEESFMRLSALITHIKEVHKMEPSEMILAKKQYKSGCYVCRFCGKKLSTHKSVLDHERIHTGEKPHECKTCGKSFRTYTARWAHVQRHKKGSYTCEHCGKVFSYKQNLLTHILIHMPVEERKHQCVKCGKKFLRKGHLNIHMRIHNGERPYTCDICNYSFTQMGDMRRHRARHSSNFMKLRKSRIKLNVPSIEKSVQPLEEKLEEIPEVGNAYEVQLTQEVENVDEMKDIQNMEVLHDADGKPITVIRGTEDMHESGQVQEVEVEEISNDWDYRINLIMNEEEPAEEIVIP